MIAAGLTLALLAAAPAALAQAMPPPLPQLTEQQSSDLERRVDAYRKATDARVARGEIMPDEADRLVRWREWQIAQQMARRAAAPPPAEDVPPDYVPPDYDAPSGYAAPPQDGPPPDYVVVEPPRYYGPYYRYAAPSYWGPRPYYYWGPTVCAGGFGRHFGGRFCF